MPFRGHAACLVLAVVDNPAPTPAVLRDAPFLIIAVAESVGADLLAPQQGDQAGDRRRHEEAAPMDPTSRRDYGLVAPVSPVRAACGAISSEQRRVGKGCCSTCRIR